MPHGYVQQFILAELDAQALAETPALWLHAHTLAERLASGRPTQAQLESVRRALRLLTVEGLVEIDARGVTAFQAADWSRHLDRRRRGRVVARIPPGEIAAAADREAARRAAEAPSSGTETPDV